MKNPAEQGGSGRRRGVSRRAFLRTAAGAAGAAWAAPMIVPASALGRGGVRAPSERIVMGNIGVGGRGTHDLSVALQQPDVQIVAVCDVNRERRERAQAAVNQRYGGDGCAIHTDFRELLARDDLDAVVMAPGDRWHTPMAVRAMRAGKDVYSEKPCTMSMAEGRQLVEAAQRYGRVFQAGMQRRSEANFILADQLALTGRLGQLHTVRAHTLPFQMKTDWLPAAPEPAKEELDWEMWLGPAAWHPYNPGYLGGCGAWLNYHDFGTGVAGWCSHTICSCHGAMGTDLCTGVEYEFPGNATAEGFTVKYANGIKMVLQCGGWRGSCGVRYEGSEGWVSIADGYTLPDVSAPSMLDDRRKLVDDYLRRHGRPLNHMRDFLDCVRSRRTPVTHAAVAAHSMATCHAVNVSMLLGRNLKWDEAKGEFSGDAEANRLLSRAVREPWAV